MGVVAKTVGKATSKAAKTVGMATSKAAKTVGGTVDDFTEKVARKAINVGEGGIIKSSIKEAGEEQLGNLTKKKINKAGGIDNLIKDNNLKKDDVINIANDLGIKTNSKTTKKNATDMINEKVGNIAKESASEATEKVSSGIGKNSFVGGAVGAVSGAGVGGIVGMATGADEDDMKSMVVLGALGGATAGGIVGGMSKALTNKGLLDVAGDMAKNGGKNLPAGGGADKLLDNVGANVKQGVSSFVEKLDNIGENVSNKYLNAKGEPLRKEIFENMKVNYGPNEAMEYANGLLGDMKVNEAFGKKANTIGGTAQGAIMGSATGALIGGVGGAIDEDETFIGGALKGGFIGGALGGAGGAVSGYFNNNARLLANTTSNVNSLFK